MKIYPLCSASDRPRWAVAALSLLGSNVSADAGCLLSHEGQARKRVSRWPAVSDELTPMTRTIDQCGRVGRGATGLGKRSAAPSGALI